MFPNQKKNTFPPKSSIQKARVYILIEERKRTNSFPPILLTFHPIPKSGILKEVPKDKKEMEC